jgi:hypothetical protein
MREAPALVGGDRAAGGAGGKRRRQGDEREDTAAARANLAQESDVLLGRAAEHASHNGTTSCT